MPFLARSQIRLRHGAIAVPLLLAACTAPPKPPPEPSPVRRPRRRRRRRVMPVEAEPAAPATQPALASRSHRAARWPRCWPTPTSVRPLGRPNSRPRSARLGDPGDAPLTQMQLALALAQTRAPADLARALGLLQRVLANPAPEAQPLQPLARALAARYAEQRRVEDDRERQAQQLRDSQRRIEQLNDRLEALRAIERSFARPGSRAAAPPARQRRARPTPAAHRSRSQPARGARLLVVDDDADMLRLLSMRLHAARLPGHGRRPRPNRR